MCTVLPSFICDEITSKWLCKVSKIKISQKLYGELYTKKINAVAKLQDFRKLNVTINIQQKKEETQGK